MPSPSIATLGVTIGSSLLGSHSQTKAANNASAAQLEAARLGIDEQRRQFDEVRKLLQPYVGAGTSALQEQMDLLGIGGRTNPLTGTINGQKYLTGGLKGEGKFISPEDAQKAAIQKIQDSPQFQILQQQSEDALLQNAAATGGLRGGNTQRSLAELRPQLLSGLIEQQYNRLGQLTGMGQNAAAGVGNAGMSTANNISNLYGQQGAALAGNALAQGQAQSNLYGNIGASINQYLGKL